MATCETSLTNSNCQKAHRGPELAAAFLILPAAELDGEGAPSGVFQKDPGPCLLSPMPDSRTAVDEELAIILGTVL